jgi:hypothetical protein
VRRMVLWAQAAECRFGFACSRTDVDMEVALPSGRGDNGRGGVRFSADVGNWERAYECGWRTDYEGGGIGAQPLTLSTLINPKRNPAPPTRVRVDFCQFVRLE